MGSQTRSKQPTVANTLRSDYQQELGVVSSLKPYIYVTILNLSLSLSPSLPPSPPSLSLSLSLSADSFNVTIQFSCTSSPPVYVTIIFKYKIYHGPNTTNGNITIYAFNNKCKCIHTIKYNLYTYRYNIARKF